MSSQSAVANKKSNWLNCHIDMPPRSQFNGIESEEANLFLLPRFPYTLEMVVDANQDIGLTAQDFQIELLKTPNEVDMRGVKNGDGTITYIVGFSKTRTRTKIRNVFKPRLATYKEYSLVKVKTLYTSAKDFNLKFHPSAVYAMDINYVRSSTRRGNPLVITQDIYMAIKKLDPIVKYPYTIKAAEIIFYDKNDWQTAREKYENYYPS